MSAGIAAAADESDRPAGQERPQSNSERLQSHLDKNSLAAQLLAAYSGAEERGRQAALRRVVAARLEALRRQYADPEDPQA